jgi:hypothetical protein
MKKSGREDTKRIGILNAYRSRYTGHLKIQRACAKQALLCVGFHLTFAIQLR